MTQATVTPSLNGEQGTAIANAVRLFTRCEPDAVVEARILDAPRPRAVTAGYFRDPHKLAEAVVREDGPAAYFVFNAVDPRCYGRSADRLKPNLKELTTDADITRRRWLFLDIDPCRPAGVSATDEEHAAALDAAERIADWLREEHAYPEPVCADSGNGAYLFYPVDLPNDEENKELVKAVTNALADRFSSDRVKIDRAVFNAARIVRLPGTMNRKGDSTDEQPHRPCRVLSAPDRIGLVTAEQLRALAPTIAAPASRGLTLRVGDNRIERARAYLAKVQRGVQGQHGSNPTFRAACILVQGFALDPAEARPLMDEYSARCDPPWSEKEIDHKLADALKANEARGRGYLLNGHSTGFSSGSHPKGEKREPNPETGFAPSILCSDLRVADPNKLWLWRPYVAPESITLFSALWKAGKTTLLAHLLRSFGAGSTFCGLAVTPARVLYVTEEGESRWAVRRDRLGLGDWIRFRVRPFVRKPTFPEWYAFLNDVVAELQVNPADLVIMDTISNLWPVVHENDAGEVTAALMPLREIAAAQILVHHLKKNDGKEATGSRGSGALMAFADTILELRRFNGDDHGCRRRVLTSWGRDEESQAELVIELNESGTGYDARGSRDKVSAEDLVDQVAELLPAVQADAMTTEHIHDSWPDSPPPHRTRLLHALSAGTETQRWNRSGEGKKGSPYRYWRHLKVPD
jgi:hypothetical protein